ncbi:glycoside hydrolase family 43 protein [Tessaracoccus defluvii]|uniref:Family 43 glycosylhydrolase n=1 Tax=Tessaracoccus defluvii TaxID=1285901 RepID=A0A7H0H2D7_9ACTN|nr:glycoside hydrolase family 43 protein [Tessaracoccus defluvii]QNP54703.1 family 43 glycosylhydrolase [Tessaracoccus defluvii]
MTALPNPLIPGFNPDPSVVRVDNDWYLATSTFEYLPGVPIYHSTDLVTWTQIGNVAVRDEQLGVVNAPTNLGVWAPTIRHRDGVFYLIVTDTAGRGTCLFTATDPAGPWSDGVVVDLEGIDPDLAWDDEGTAYVTYSGLVLSGPDLGAHRGIEQIRIDTVTGALLGEKRSLWSGDGGMFPEAPHLYRHGDHWYLLVAEGGTERGHSISIARGPSPEGPFTSCPANPLVTARGTARPVQCTGHGDLFEGPDGQWYVAMLGTRPRGMVRSFSALGRETFISPARWTDDGWLEIDQVELNPRPGFGWVEDFDGELGPQWIGVRRRPDQLADLTSRPGWLVLTGEGEGMGAFRPVFIGHRQQHQTCEIATVADASAGVGGLAVRYDEGLHYEVEASPDGTVTARAVIPGFVREATAQVGDGPVELILGSRVPPAAGLGHVSSDLVRLGYRDEAGEHILLEVDARYLSNETAGSFTGRVFGVYATSGTVAFAHVDYAGDNS